MKTTIKSIFSAAMVSAMVFTAEAAGRYVDVKGVVTDTEHNPIAGVVVTNGKQFTQTDERGRYRIKSHSDTCKFVYISIPSGYHAAVERSLPVGYYAAIDDSKKSQKCDFTVEKDDETKTGVTFIEISDPQVKKKKHVDRLVSETIPDLRATVDSLNAAGRMVYGIALGDIVWDAMDLFPVWCDAIDGMALTMYHVIGNHDFDKQYAALSRSSDKSHYGEMVYSKYFGPTDYSFNVGNTHVVVMKSIDYEGNKQYDEQFTVDQLNWLRQDLSYVAPGSLVVVNLHAPTANTSNGGSGNATNADEFFGLLRDYRTHIFSGHTHFFENRIVTPNIYDHNIGAACGAWWVGDVNRDGSPNGYMIVDINGDDLKWKYKATGRSTDYQMRIYTPGEFESQKDYLVVNVWDYDPAWRLSYYEDGVERVGVLEQFQAEDQDFITMKGKAAGYGTLHLFRVRPSYNTRKITIVATNRFGEQFTSEAVL